MLKAFDYTEENIWEENLSSEEFVNLELKFAKEFIADKKPFSDKEECPACGGKKGKLFFNKWGINYCLCQDCYSVYANADKDTIDSYRNYEPLKQIIKSEKYQKESLARRKNNWSESLEWLEIRCFRYLRKNTGLEILEWGNRFKYYSKLIADSRLCSNYICCNNIFNDFESDKEEKQFDLILATNYFQQSYSPMQDLNLLRSKLNDTGVIVVSNRLGSGFDILSLKEESNIFPYEHIFLPSKEGMQILLQNAGFEVLEITTPGIMDVKYVRDARDKLDEANMFVKYIMDKGDRTTALDFQRFLQKSGLSSYAQIIARKRK